MSVPEYIIMRTISTVLFCDQHFSVKLHTQRRLVGEGYFIILLFFSYFCSNGQSFIRFKHTKLSMTLERQWTTSEEFVHSSKTTTTANYVAVSISCGIHFFYLFSSAFSFVGSYRALQSVQHITNSPLLIVA